MKEYTITEQFALLALNGQDSLHTTQAKKAAIIGIAIGEFIQEMLFLDKQYSLAEIESQLQDHIKKVKLMGGKARNKIEKDVTGQLKEKAVLTEVPALLGCDINYYTAGNTMREYKSDSEEYQRIAESIRATILEPGEIPKETFVMLWLLRECGCFHDIFSNDEQRQIGERMLDITAIHPLYEMLWELEFRSVFRDAYVKFLGWKGNLFKNPYLEGVNLLYPFMDRRQAVFIDMVVLGTSVKNRRQAAIQFLRNSGHMCEEVKRGEDTLVKIDNEFYRIWPATRIYKLPVQGVELLPVYK